MIHLNIGSNLNSNFGNKFDNISIAIKLLIEKKFDVKKISNFYETPSYPNKNLPNFLNVGVFGVFNKSAKDLLADYYLQCLFSKINKTYYLLIRSPNDRSDFQYVYYKTKKEKDLTKELGLLRTKIVKDGYFIPK